MGFLDEIDGLFPIRRSDEQKRAFRAWAVSRAEEMGYAVRVREDGGKKAHRNIEIGDPSRAKVIFSAHYDTPARSLFPNLLLPANPGLGVLYAVLTVLPLVAAAMLAGFGVMRFFRTESFNMQDSMAYRLGVILVYLAAYFALFMAKLRGAANPRNRNDNTSGVAAIFRTMELMPASARGEAAFLLFDNEEKGKLGSKAFSKANPAIQEKTLLVNLDCVGNGDNLVMVTGKKTAESPLYPTLQKALGAQGFPLTVLGYKEGRANSDHVNFDMGASVLACRRGKIARFVTGRIHTARDVAADGGNVEAVARGLTQFMQYIKEETGVGR